MEFEGSKHEIRRLQEEVDILNSQVDELTNLKKIAEKQMEEALGALQSEREQKYALKKELDQRLNSESTSMFNLSNLAFSGFKFGQSKRPSSSNSSINNYNTINDEQIIHSNISKPQTDNHIKYSCCDCGVYICINFISTIFSP